MRPQTLPPEVLPRNAERAVAKLDAALNAADRPDWLQLKLSMKRRLDRVPLNEVAREARRLFDGLRNLPPAA